MTRLRLCLFAVASLLADLPAHAQNYQLTAGNFNNIFIAPAAPPVGANENVSTPGNVQAAATPNSNFQSMGQVSGSTGPVAITIFTPGGYPGNYPANTLRLVQSSIGGSFASGVPLYYFGDEIIPPLVREDGSKFTGETDAAMIAAARAYWRAQPIMPGENIPGLGILSPLESVTVSATPPAGSTDRKIVTTTTKPSSLVVGSILLGQPVTKISGTGPSWTVTLAGDANEVITSSVTRDITPAQPFYYSRHADKVFASQPGQVSVIWLKRDSVVYRTETFLVSASSQRPVRNIFWTEGSFNGPKVQITDARITTVNPVYYASVPKAVAEEVSVPGYTPMAPNLTTLSFEKFNGTGQLRAHNVEGRILIEYLGNVVLGDTHVSLGTDVVELKREPEVVQVVQHLGKQLTPRSTPLASDELLEASPMLNAAQGTQAYYGTTVLPDGKLAYHAERETSAANDPDNGQPASSDAFNKVVFYWLESPPDNFGIKWPKFQSRYWQRWSPDLGDYAHYTVDATGSTPATGISFSGGTLPTLAWQDDPAQSEARIDLDTQRFHVVFPSNSDLRNRSLLKFSASGKVWYVNVYTQAEERQITRAADADGSSVVTLASTAGLEVGMVITGAGISGSATIVRIIDSTHIEISQTVSTDTNYVFSVESDAAASIHATATVGTRIPQPAGHENAGYISSGTGYYPAGYLNPFTTGIPAANLGAIIPVNALPGNNVLKVRWFRKVPAPDASFQDLYVPGKIGRYTVSYPQGNGPRIVIAEGAGSGPLPAAEASGSIYVQNVAAQPGFNPNEEHALMLGGRAYAMRDDLNVYPGGSNYTAIRHTSEPFVLLAYTDPVDLRPAIRAFRVMREVDANGDHVKDPGDILFDYTAVAGTLLAKPYPLPLLPLPMTGTGANRKLKDVEIVGADAPVNNHAEVKTDKAYTGFTFNDRKGFTWIHRGPHAAGTPTLTMKLYYYSRASFYLPGATTATGTVPALETMLPFLRSSARSGQVLDLTKIDAGATDHVDQPLSIVYRPAWPDNAPDLRVGETLTLPKFGLPQVRGQSSAEVLYQQSIALDDSNSLGKNSVTLHDPTRMKVATLGANGIDLESVPSSIKTTGYQGKNYFQGLPPSLQKRFFHDPTVGTKGSLCLLGTFHHGPDEGFSGDDYLDLNLLTSEEETVLKELIPAGDAKEDEWIAAIEGLKTAVQTFVPDSAQAGTFKVGQSVDVYATRTGDREPLAVIDSQDTAVDSYALTATGQGTGFVTMVFGNGQAFTNPGDPVQVKVFRIGSQLYTGDLKALLSSNPLDEQVTLRHSGDFAGKPEDYEFEWRWAAGAASEPATYTSSMARVLGDAAAETPTNRWLVVSDPGAVLPDEDQYEEASESVIGSRNVHPVAGIFTAQGELVNLPATQVTVSNTSALSVGMSVVGPGITGTATIVSIIDSTRYVLSQVIPAATATFTYGGSLSLASTSSSLAENFIEAESYTAAEIVAGYPALVARSSVGVDFSAADYPLGVPESIVLSARVGVLDGFVLYVNGRPAVAYNAPTPQFTLTNARTGLTPLGNSSGLKQFYIAPGYFNAGPNTIEVAIYSTADANAFSELDFILEAAQETDAVVSGDVWEAPNGQNGATGLLPYGSSVIVGGSTAGPFGGSTFVLNDRWFTMRYRPKASADNVLGTPWSRWAPPQFVEGWIKRVLAAINPFEQRVKDLYNNSINSDVSVITQAGRRWEGDVALNLENINDAGLIEIYETVLNRGKNMSINANTNDGDSNNALLLAAGYLSDLYSILGNEAYADAANPTISIDDPSSVFEVSTSRFSFEGQVASSLDEELALLRGRDDFVSPGVRSAPAYNRLVWNYTRGINSGEAIYAVNYNIKEKAGSSTANGVIDESDAQRMFPQGHGDAYGHYLTALTGYYSLLSNPNFSWQARAEAVTVNGQPVTVDFADERKFAAAAANVARTAQQIVALTHRQRYKDDASLGWGHFRDGTVNNNVSPATTRHQGLDEWVSRSSQGAYYHWIVGNALVPDVDHSHTGVQKIDRTTVPELAQLSSAAHSFQTTIDNANSRLNPLGLSPDAVALDIDPYFATSLGQELAGNGFQGASQHEQIYDRALRSLNNAAGAFKQAATMTRSLRDQENQLDDFNTTLVQQETAYVNQLIDIYGRPYAGDIGPGKLYAQGYTGPDLHHWFIVDRPASLVAAVDSSKTFTIETEEAVDISTFTSNKLQDIISDTTAPHATKDVSYDVQPSQWVQYSDVWPTSGTLGSRPETGELQAALLDAQQTWLALSELNVSWGRETAELEHLGKLFADLLRTQAASNTELSTRQAEILRLEKLVRDREIVAATFDLAGDLAWNAGDAMGETFPDSILDIFSAGEAAAKYGGLFVQIITKTIALATSASARAEQTKMLEEEQGLEKRMQELGFSSEAVQLAYEYDNLYRSSISGANELTQLALAHQRALQNVSNVIARGNRVLAEREVFRQRAAAIIQGYRTRDLSFRIFRNEALEQYRSLFDLASRYTYLTAKAYDYETALLGTPQGKTVFDRIVASRSLGDLTDGKPQSTTSTLGDGGLAGMMAQINSDFSVAEGRLGINNPDYYGTVFSLRGELFRLLDTPGDTSGDDAWRQTLERHTVDNLLNDADVSTQCRNIQKPDGSAVPGIIIEFGSTIEHGKNFFGLPLAAYDHFYSASSFGTKISNAGVVLQGYIGMDASISGLTDEEGNPDPAAGNPANALSGTPYVYLIPCGTDQMRAPLSGNNEIIRSWKVQDQALPLPYNLGANDFNTTQFFNANGTFSEQPWVIRRHQAFRAVGRDDLFYGAPPLEFSTSRLIARSAWNTRWKLVIPAYTLLNNEKEGLKRFAASVSDIKLYLRTYSHSGN